MNFEQIRELEQKADQAAEALGSAILRLQDARERAAEGERVPELAELQAECEGAGEVLSEVTSALGREWMGGR
ncbi:MAG: hypothetical protein ACM336_03300 [Acidobacteriota bacterium]